MTLRACLVAPPNPPLADPRIGPPLGLLYLAAAARDGGVPVDHVVVDLNVACYPAETPRGHWTHDFSISRCLAEIPEADVYGFGVASAQVPHARALIRALRERHPAAVFVVGGPHASATGPELLRDVDGGDAADVVVAGEGEDAWCRILRALLEGRKPSGIVRGEPMWPRCAGHPARDLLDWSRYTRRINGEPATNIITSRGCPGRCAFCQQETLWSGALRLSPSERVLDEVDDIHAVTGIRHLLFLDDSLTARSASEMRAIAEGLGQRGVLWRGWTRADLCLRPSSAETLRAIRDNGCQALCIGVEAGTDRLLRRLDKRTTTAQNSAALRTIHHAGLSARASIMVGIPGETWADVYALVRWVQEHAHLIDDWILSTFVPMPGSPAWDHADRYGLEIDRERAVREHYAACFVVGGDERSGRGYHRHLDGTTATELDARHHFVQEALLGTVGRERYRVTVGGSR